MRLIRRLLGGMLIISGTTIGAGMIALPITSAHLGFIASTALLLGMWALMCYTALVTLEVNLYFGHGVNISHAAEELLGPWGRVVSSGAILLLFYSLLAAYIAGGSSIIKHSLEAWLDMKILKGLVSIVFTIVLGFFVYARTEGVDYANRLLFGGMLVCFLGLIMLLIPEVKAENLMSSTTEFGPFWAVIPIFFTSFGFHGSIPPIVDYLGHHPGRLKFAFIVGSLIPLVFYLLWQIVTVGVLPLFGTLSFSNVFASENDVGVFVGELNAISGSGVLPWVINNFTALAISTSFLGVGIGLMEFFLQKMKWSHTKTNRIKGALATLALPLMFAILYPQGFVMALGFAAVVLSIIAVIMPVLMVLVIRSRVNAGQDKRYRAPGGTFGLLFALIVGLIVVGVQIVLIIN